MVLLVLHLFFMVFVIVVRLFGKMVKFGIWDGISRLIFTFWALFLAVIVGAGIVSVNRIV